MPWPVEPPSPGGALIAEVERRTGIPRATLRIWERRYGFPAPGRVSSGERVYSGADIERLLLIRRLMDAGEGRPGALLALPADELARRAATAGAATAPRALEPAFTQNDPSALLRLMRHELARLGLQRFVLERAVGWVQHVGAAWASGSLAIFEEHLFTQVLQSVLAEAVLGLAATSAGGSPGVLLATLAGELHVLGLGMAHALLALEGCECAMLGASTPVGEVVRAAERLHADVVVISMSAHTPPTAGQRQLAQLREQLPAATALWAGGACSGLRRFPAAGVRVFDSLAQLAPAVADYRARA